MKSFVRGMGKFDLYPSSRISNRRYGDALQMVHKSFLKTGDNMRRAIIEVNSTICPLPEKIRVIGMGSDVHLKDVSFRMTSGGRIRIIAKNKETADSLKGVKFIFVHSGKTSVDSEEVKLLEG